MSDFLSIGEQKTLHFLVANVAHLGSYQFSSQMIAPHLEFTPGAVGKILKKLDKLKYLSYTKGRGKRRGRVNKILEKGLKFPFDTPIPESIIKEEDKVEQSVLPLEIPGLDEITDPKPTPTNGATQPRPWETPKVTAEEELENIRVLVQPRAGETVYEAVQALFQYATQK